MDRLAQLRETMALTIGIEPSRVTAQTTQSEIAEWDSVGHLNLMLALEQTFDLRLEVEQMTQLTSVPAILEFVEAACRSN
jgi:acyl carrier protein